MITKYRVYIAQVNQTYVDVVATSPEQAAERAYDKWRRHYAHSAILSVVPAPAKKAE